MGVATSLKTSQYYDFFRDKEVVFTKANIKSLKVDPREIYLKCNGGQWPCIINSSSLQQAKIIVGTSCGIFDILRKNKAANVSLRYGFFEQGEKIQFFVTCNVINIERYQGTNDLALMTLAFTQRPPDDLILRLGEFIEVNENFRIQYKQKIPVNADTLNILSIPKEETYIYIQGVPRKCIMKDISFGGTTLLLVGIPKFLEKREVEFRLIFTDNGEKIALKGVIESAAFLPGRKDISIVSVVFVPELVPMSYKFRINSFLTSSRKNLLQKQNANKPVESVVGKRVFENEAKRAENSGKSEKLEKIAETTEKIVGKTAEIAEKVADKVSEKVSEKVDKIEKIAEKVNEKVAEKKEEVAEKVTNKLSEIAENKSEHIVGKIATKINERNVEKNAENVNKGSSEGGNH